MNKADFMNISQEECLIVYKQVLDRSERKFKSAELVAKDGDYESATSLLIVSNEELLKGLILYLSGQGFRLRSIQGIKSLFANHKLRYLFALVLSVFSIAMNEMQFYIRKVLDDHDFLLEFNPDTPEFKANLKKYFSDKLLDIKKEVLFFSAMDKSRQHGFYSDYKDGIITISEAQYLEFHDKIKRLNAFVYMLIDVFKIEHLPIKKQLERMKNGFNTKRLTYFNKLLKKINDPKYNSYKSLIDIIDGAELEVENMVDEILDRKSLKRFKDDRKKLKKLSTKKASKKLKA